MKIHATTFNPIAPLSGSTQITLESNQLLSASLSSACFSLSPLTPPWSCPFALVFLTATATLSFSNYSQGDICKAQISLSHSCLKPFDVFPLCLG